jgi:Domain of unknown function (DUF4382)
LLNKTKKTYPEQSIENGSVLYSNKSPAQNISPVFIHLKKKNMTALKKSVFLSLIATSAIFHFSSCQKSDIAAQQETKQLNVFLTDGPGPFDNVLIDIQYAEVKLDTCTGREHDDHFGDNDADADDNHSHRDAFGKWDTLSIRRGVYDVLSLRNGIDTLLASGTVTGKIRKIRLTLGSSNIVIKNGVSYPLLLLPGSTSYLYVSIHNEHQHNAGTATSIWVDFDLGRSIIEQNGQYYLKPVLNPFCNDNFARLEGKVLPAAANPFVMVFNATDTATAIPGSDGAYRIRGLKEGIYTILFRGSNGYKDNTITNVVLQKGKETNITAVVLVQ